MTAKQFSDKYDIPYKTVYDATYRVKGINCEYPEDELYQAIITDVLEKISKHEEIIHKQLEIIRKMRCTNEMPKV